MHTVEELMAILRQIVDAADDTGCDGTYVVDADLINTARDIVYPD